jgi:hypothetical protein
MTLGIRRPDPGVVSRSVGVLCSLEALTRRDVIGAEIQDRDSECCVYERMDADMAGFVIGCGHAGDGERQPWSTGLRTLMTAYLAP